MDLVKTLNVEEAAGAGAVMAVRHPVTDEPLMDGKVAVTITLLGADSKVWRSKINGIAQKAKGRRKGIEGMTIGESQNEMLALYAAVTSSWTGIDHEGSPECTFATAKAVYGKSAWLVEQIKEFVENRGNFLGEDSGSLSSTLEPSSPSG